MQKKKVKKKAIVVEWEKSQIKTWNVRQSIAGFLCLTPCVTAKEKSELFYLYINNIINIHLSEYLALNHDGSGFLR